MKASRRITISFPNGLHLRPAGEFARMVGEYACSVEVECAGNRVDGGSAMMLLSLGAGHGSELIVHARGDDAERAVAELALFLESYNDETDATADDGDSSIGARPTRRE